MRTYLGDGVYVELEGTGTIKLVTSDGLRDTNTIYLEPEVYLQLVAWADMHERAAAGLRP